jgi:hypothetical protein
MKSYKQFISESVNIVGDFNGNLYINGSESEQKPIGEKFVADIVWEGKLYRMEILSNKIPTRESLGEQIQQNYPGAIVHNIYPAEYNNNSALRITGIKRYQPEKLSWTD